MIERMDILYSRFLRLREATLAGAAFCLLAALLMPQPAQAQAFGPTREEIQRERLDERLRNPSQATALDGGIERAPCPLANPQFADVRFTFTDATFTGIESLDPQLLRPAWESYVGQELSVAAVCEIRDRAATILRGSGYLASVQIPPQEIDDGTVQFEVLVGRLTAVQVRGEPGPSAGLLQKYIDKITGTEVFNVQQAERYLLLARDIPGLDVRLTLRPASAGGEGRPGEVVGIIDVNRTPFFADMNIQNYGSDEVGRFGGLLRARFNGLTGLGDETTVSGFLTANPDEQQVIQASHEMRIGGEGLRLGFSGTYAWTEPDVPGPNVFDSETLVASAYTAFPFVRSQTKNLTAVGGLELIDQNIDFAGLPLSQDKQRVAFARVEFSSIDRGSLLGRGGHSPIEPKWGLAAAIEARQGLDIFGASDSCGAGFVNCLQPGAVPLSRLDGDPTGFVVRGEASLDWRPNPEITFSLRPRVQYSPDNLLSYEQISGGNYTAGRGYDPGAVIGDSGYGVQAEVAFGSLIPDTPGGTAVQTFFFADHMGVFTNDVPGDPQDITSAGGGFRFSFGQRAFLETYLATPIERAPTQLRRSDTRFLMNLTVLLAPWN